MRQTFQINITNTSNNSIIPTIHLARPSSSGLLTSAVDVPVVYSKTPLPRQSERLDPLLRKTLTEPKQRARYLIYLNDQVDLSSAYRISNWNERGRYVYQTLVDHAERTQASLRAELSARGMPFTPLWIVNAIVTEGRLSDAQALIARSDVALIRANRVMSQAPVVANTPAETTDKCSPDNPGNPICWNVRQVEADRAWREFGVTGAGIVVATIDSGADANHVALARSYRGYQAAGGATHDYNWFDPQRVDREPKDASGHGTHVLGTMVGVGNGSRAQPSIGLAPGATWIAANGCTEVFCAEEDLFLSAQWTLAPTRINGSEPRPDLRPMIINNSWGGPGNDDYYAGYTAAWRAAGIFPVFAAGNTSAGDAGCGTVFSPGDYEDVVAVGASDQRDQIARFSLLGPSAFKRTKPDFVAPGTHESYKLGIYSAAPTNATALNTYRDLNGTSMAAPHVSAAVALIWSANPTLIGDYAATYDLLRTTALRLPSDRCGGEPSGFNNTFGHGRINVYAAVKAARVQIPWLRTTSPAEPLEPGQSRLLTLEFDSGKVATPGVYTAQVFVYSQLTERPMILPVTLQVEAAEQQATLSGTILSQRSGSPIQAQIDLNGATTTTDAQGNYRMVVAINAAARNANLRVTAAGHRPMQRTLDLSATLQLSVTLPADQPQLSLPTSTVAITTELTQPFTTTLPLQNVGTQPLHYSLSVANDRYSVWRSDNANGPTYQWRELPADAKVLQFDTRAITTEIPIGFAFRAFNSVVTQTVIAKHGMLSLLEPFNYTDFSGGCLPDNAFLFNTFAPFRADLDPARGGQVRYATFAEEGLFVVSFEQVPLRTGAQDQHYTFQVLLHRDGRVVYQYQQLAALPDELSIGFQRTNNDWFEMACGRDAPLRSGLAIELRPQPLPSNWVKTPTMEGVLLPGETQLISVTLNWIRPTQMAPYRSRLLLRTTDPYQTRIQIPVELNPRPARFEILLPLLRRNLS
jgi:hypothetical protein